MNTHDQLSTKENLSKSGLSDYWIFVIGLILISLSNLSDLPNYERPNEVIDQPVSFNQETLLLSDLPVSFKKRVLINSNIDK